MSGKNAYIGIILGVVSSILPIVNFILFSIYYKGTPKYMGSIFFVLFPLMFFMPIISFFINTKLRETNQKCAKIGLILSIIGFFLMIIFIPSCFVLIWY